MLALVKALFIEYKTAWAANRALYLIKLRMLNLFPVLGVLFERPADVKRVDLFYLDVSALGGFLKSLPEEKRRGVTEMADAAIEGRIKAFDSLYLEYGSPIDWQLNPITGKCTDVSKRWHGIPDFDKQRGDIKAIWEPSRLTHFFSFARAYLLTGEERYYEAFSDQLAHWLDANPYPYGANYKCGQECALRMINVLLTAPVFANLLTEKDKDNLKKLVKVCYKKIQSNFFYAHRCVKNNHTFSEIAGLIVGTWCCDDKKGLRKAYRLMETEIKKQFTPDGGYLQYSFNYQRFTLQVIEALLKMEHRTGIQLSQEARAVLENSVSLLYQMQQDDGSLPNYGSNDGALIFPLSVCDYKDFRPFLNTLHFQLTGSRLYDSGEYDEELYWFGEPDALIAPVTLVARKSAAFDEAGLYSLRDGCAFAMLVCQRYYARPAHFDQLHLDLWYNGINIFCDSGTYSYASVLGVALSLTAAHNVVVADGREQMNKKGAFFVYNWTKRNYAAIEEDTFCGAFWSGNKYGHRRAVRISGDTCEIADEVTGADTVERLFHTPCEVVITDGGFDLLTDGIRVCKVLCLGSISVDKSKGSRYYMRQEDVNLIKIQTTAADVQTINIQFVRTEGGE